MQIFCLVLRLHKYTGGNNVFFLATDDALSQRGSTPKYGQIAAIHVQSRSQQLLRLFVCCCCLLLFMFLLLLAAAAVVVPAAAAAADATVTIVADVVVALMRKRAHLLHEGRKPWVQLTPLAVGTGSRRFDVFAWGTDIIYWADGLHSNFKYVLFF